MQQFCQYGSVRGATGNRRPYRDNLYPTGYRGVLLPEKRTRDRFGNEEEVQ